MQNWQHSDWHRECVMTEFLNNQVVNWNGDEYRVLASLKGQAALCRMDGSMNLGLKIVPVAELVQAKESGKLIEVDDKFIELRARPLSEKSRISYNLIEPIVSHPESVFFPHQRNELINSVANGKKSLKRKLFRLLSLYYQRGQCQAALNPNYFKSEKKERKYKAKPGPKPSVPGGAILDDELRGLMDKVCRECLLRENGMSVAKAHIRLISEYKAKHPDAGTDALPSVTQLRYFYKTRFNAREKAVKRYGSRIYNKDIDALTGNTYDVAEGPGAVYEIDATLADAFLVSQADPSKAVGRPYIYSVVDTHTGMIVGIHASFEPPQFKTACDALYAAMTDKTEFCRKYGIELGEKHHWDVKGIPACIVADNAELQTDRFESFLSAYGVINSFTASGRPDCKGTVENSIHLLQSELSVFIDAAPDKIDLKKAGHQEKRHKATLNLHDFTQMLIRAVLVVNKRLRTNTPRYLPATEASTPETLWRWGREHCMSALKSENNAERLRIILLPKYKPTLSEDGITANKITYFCKEARDAGFFERRSARPDTKDMQLAVDPDDVSKAYFFPDVIRNPLTYWPCTLAAKSRQVQDMTQKQAQEHLKQAQASNRKAEQEAALYQSEMLAEQKETVRQAKERKPKSEESVASQIAAIGSNRKEERAYQAQANPRISSDEVEKLKASLVRAETQYPTAEYPDNIDDIPD